MILRGTSELYPNFLGNERDIDQAYLDSPKAEELHVVGLGLKSILGLIDFKHLRKLSISGVYSTGMKRDSVERFTALPQFESLRELEIHDCLKFGDYEISLVAKMPRLEILRIKSYIRVINDIRPLGALSTLERVELTFPWNDDLERQSELIRFQLPKCRFIVNNIDFSVKSDNLTI
jgi:hypothetical protein